MRDVLSTLLIVLVVDAAFFFFNKIYFSRLAFAVQWLLLISLLPTLRTLLKIYSLKRGTWQIPIRMIGSGINAHEAWLALKSEGLMGYQLVEVVLTNDKQPDWVKVPILTWDDGLKPTPEMQVVVALEAEQQSELNESVRRLYNFCPNMIIVPSNTRFAIVGYGVVTFIFA